MLSFLEVILISLLIFVAILFNQIQRKPYVFSVYRPKSQLFYLKWCIAYILVKFGKKTKPVIAKDVDRLNELANSPTAVDAVYFNTSSISTGQIVTFATAIRSKGLVNTFSFLRIPEFSDDLLVLPQYPDTRLYRTKEQQANLDSYAVEGIKLTPHVPMKSWKIEYNGKMKLQNDAKKEVTVKLNAIWSSHLPAFNYDIDISKYAISKGMALQSWNSKYFNDLKETHQTHFEQYGKLTGTVAIDGRDYALATSGVRDHTTAHHRDWKDIHRYVLHFITLENGDGISVGVVSIPIMFSRLVIGFVSKESARTNYSIDECSIKFEELEGQTKPAEKYEFSFWSGSKEYKVEVVTLHQPQFYIGSEAESRLVELFCEYTVNGIKGWGAAEWHYRNVDGIPQ